MISVLMPTSGIFFSVYPPYLNFVAVYKWSGLVSPSGIVSSVVVVIFSTFIWKNLCQMLSIGGLVFQGEFHLLCYCSSQHSEFIQGNVDDVSDVLHVQ